MRSHAKASAARSTKASRIGAPKAKLTLIFGAALALVLALGVTLAAAVVPTVTVENAQNVTATSALAKGTVDPQGKETSCHFEYVSQAQLDENVGNGAGEFEAAGAAECDGNPHEGTGAQDVEANLTGLAPNTVYHLRLVASNEDGQSEAVAANTFKTAATAPSAVTIPAFALEGGHSALLGGRVNPNNSATAYWVEYGTTTGYGTSAPAAKNAAAGAGGVDKVVTQEVSGLTPGTLYHYRLVAKNAQGETPGEDMTFKTASAPLQPAVGSCPNEAFRVGPSAALPDCRAYELVSLPDLGGSSVRMANPQETNLRSTEWSPVSPDGSAVIWGTDAVLPGAPQANGGPEFYVSRRGVDGWSDKPVGPPGNEVGGASTPGFVSPSLDRIAWFTFGATLPGDDGPFDPDNVSTNVDYYREEPNGTFVHLNQGSDPQPAAEDFPAAQGSTPDGMKFLFSEIGRLLEPEALPGSLYLRSGNTTEIVSRDENNVSVDSDPGSIISEDGSTVAFGMGTRVWIRDLDAGHSTLAASAPGFSAIQLSALSTDGTRLILSSSDPLTPDDEDSSTDLYEYNAGTGTLTRLSTGSPGSGNDGACGASNCDASFFTATKDGSEAYFVSAEQLDGGKGVEGSPNLYLRAGGQTTYVTTLAPSDNSLSTEGGRGHRFRLTPDESTLLFEAGSRITAYDSAGHNEIYAYDSDTGRVTCVSCRPDGAAPSGEAKLREGPTVGSGLEAFARSGLNLVNSDADGRHYYFHTTDPLVPADVNSGYDVYEYDVASATPMLISDGKGDSFAAFWGNSLDGRDIFFATGQSLTSDDASVSAIKVYDARVGGGFPTPVKPAPCEGEQCRGQGSTAPAPAAPSTSSFEGPPNPKPSHKVKKHKKKHQKHKRHGKKKRHDHKRTANANGRTGR